MSSWGGDQISEELRGAGGEAIGSLAATNVKSFENGAIFVLAWLFLVAGVACLVLLSAVWLTSKLAFQLLVAILGTAGALLAFASYFFAHPCKVVADQSGFLAIYPTGHKTWVSYDSVTRLFVGGSRVVLQTHGGQTYIVVSRGIGMNSVTELGKETVL